MFCFLHIIVQTQTSQSCGVPLPVPPSAIFVECAILGPLVAGRELHLSQVPRTSRCLPSIVGRVASANIAPLRLPWHRWTDFTRYTSPPFSYSCHQKVLFPPFLLSSYLVFTRSRRTCCWELCSAECRWQWGYPERGVEQRIATSATNQSISSTTGCPITEKAPTRAFSWLKVATTAFTFKTLLRHYAKLALTPRSLNVKLGPRLKGHKGRAVWLA